MTLDKFKLAVLDLDDFTDAQVEELLLNLEINDEGELHEVLEVIERHRPEVLKHLAEKYCYPKKPTA